MARGVKMQPRARASATVVPPQEQERDCGSVGGCRREMERWPRLVRPQKARRRREALRMMLEKRLVGERGACWGGDGRRVSVESPGECESGSISWTRWV